jgi:hypothetical protein
VLLTFIQWYPAIKPLQLWENYNSANKRQSVTMNQILTQKWFLLQNIKDSSLNRNGVFENGAWTYNAVARLAEFRQTFPNLN